MRRPSLEEVKNDWRGEYSKKVKVTRNLKERVLDEAER